MIITFITNTDNVYKATWNNQHYIIDKYYNHQTLVNIGRVEEKDVIFKNDFSEILCRLNGEDICGKIKNITSAVYYIDFNFINDAIKNKDELRITTYDGYEVYLPDSTLEYTYDQGLDDFTIYKASTCMGKPNGIYLAEPNKISNNLNIII